MERQKKVLKKVIIGSTVFALALLAITYKLSHNYLYFSRHKPYTHTPLDFDLTYENVSFLPKGHNIKLNGWFVPGKNPDKHAPTVILVHGHNTNMSNGHDINLLRDVAVPLNQQGYATLLFDLRNHGSSGDMQPVSLGYFESQDILGAINYLKDNADLMKVDRDRIGIWAASMGGAAAIHAASISFQENKSDIKALFIDSTYAKTLDPIRLRLSKDGLPSIIQEMAIFWIRTIPQFDIANFNPVDHLQNIKAPIYFVHAEDDKVVHYKDSVTMEQRFKSHHPNIDVFLWITDASKHVFNVKEYPQEYKNRLLNFFKSYL